MRRLLAALAAPTLALTVGVALAAPAQAQTDDQFNRRLIHRYGCTTSPTDTHLIFPPTRFRGFLVTDFFPSPDQRWIHVKRFPNYPSTLQLRLGDLYVQAVCLR